MQHGPVPDALRQRPQPGRHHSRLAGQPHIGQLLKVIQK